MQRWRLSTVERWQEKDENQREREKERQRNRKLLLTFEVYSRYSDESATESKLEVSCMLVLTYFIFSFLSLALSLSQSLVDSIL